MPSAASLPPTLATTTIDDTGRANSMVECTHADPRGRLKLELAQALAPPLALVAGCYPPPPNCRPPPPNADPSQFAFSGFDEVFPLWCLSTVGNGGLDWSSQQIGQVGPLHKT